MEETITQQKRRLRAEMRQRISQLDEKARQAKSGVIAERVLSLPEFRCARTVMLFAGMADEVDTAPLIKGALAAGKRVGLPRCLPERRQMEVVEVSDPGRDLAAGAYGILEPVGRTLIAPEELDLIVVPGRAFDRCGNRLGRGAAYYDRFLVGSAAGAARLGICFHCQLLDAIPHLKTDIPVHIIVTEHETIRTQAT